MWIATLVLLNPRQRREQCIKFLTAELAANENRSDASVALNDSGIRGRMPDNATLEGIPQAGNDKSAASTLVQDGKLLYEMGKFDEAEAKLNQALKLDPDDQSAQYYLNLDKQADFAREERSRSTLDERQHGAGGTNRNKKINRTIAGKVEFCSARFQRRRHLSGTGKGIRSCRRRF